MSFFLLVNSSYQGIFLILGGSSEFINNSTKFLGIRDVRVGKHGSNIYRSIPQILGNIDWYIEVFNMGDPSRNTTKFNLEYIRIET